MITWTDAAKEVLENYCRRTRENLRDSGADPDEVIDDLRRHVEEEIRAAKVTLVTEEEMRRILARVGEPANAQETAQSPQPESTEIKLVPSSRPSGLFLTCAFLFGVILPAGTLIFELMTGISASVLFDPVPNWIQLIAVALVPIVNVWLIVIARKGRTGFPKLAGWLSGAMIAVCAFYSVLYLPFVPFAFFAIAYFGAGLVPLAPYFALIFTALLRNSAAMQPGVVMGSARRGFAVGIAVLILVQVPIGITYYGAAAMTSDDTAAQKRGLTLLRWFGDRDLLLRNCYFGVWNTEWPFDLVRALAGGNKGVSSDQSREIFYRVTGKPFNAVHLPQVYRRYGNWMGMDEEFTWDEGLGGEAVAGRVKGLSLNSSRLDAVTEPNAAVAYCEWTLEFKNVSSMQREARAQIALPPGAVVSRLTLWVDGEEREAAFGGRSEVRGAYQQVAVVQRHDPVLVTTCGPDRVLMQCFPVPPNGGTMKVRMGMTAPLQLESLAQGRFAWPKFVERNFSEAPDFKTSVWIDSPQKISTRSKTLLTDNEKGKVAVHGTVTDADLSEVTIERAAGIRRTWTPALETNQIVVQRIEEAEAEKVPLIVFVLDGSAGMADAKREIAEAIGKMPAGSEVSVIIAHDEVEQLNGNPTRADDALLKNLSRDIRGMHCAGGCDNLPALVEAWDAAVGAEGSAIVWIHDAQPVLLSSTDALQQRIERSGHRIPIYDLQTHAGPNRIAEKMDAINLFKRVPEVAESAGGDLENLLRVLNGKTMQYLFIREKIAADSTDDRGERVGRHIERLWARDEARKLTSARHRDDAIRLAARQQLVTPVTGAVVLETKQQYAANGLEPAAPESVPMIPEPGAISLWLIGGTCLIWYRWKKNRSTSRGSEQHRVN
jgi:hypothetical protein